MTLEEAILHAEEVAREQDKLATRYEDASGYTRSHIESLKTDESIKCRECAKEHRQLAEWLRELKAYREELPKEIKNAKVRQADALEANVKNENYNSHLAEYIKGYLCGLSYAEGIIAKIIEEVNADADSD